MVYALVRGWLAGMTAILIEIILAATLFAPDFSSHSFIEGSAATTLPVIMIALIEEGLKFTALLGINAETKPFFRNAIFKGLLVGIGFALFEICIKVLFHNETEENSVFLGALASTILHSTTGILLGVAWFLRNKNRPSFFFPALFFLAVTLHSLYNIFLSPLLFEKFS